MSNIEKLLPSAVEAVKEHVLVDGKVPKEFNGHVSSFGAAMINSGLLPTLVFYSQKGEGSDSKIKILKAMEMILNEKHKELLNDEGNLLDTVFSMVKKDKNMERLCEKIQEAGIALKLASRMFPKSDK